MGTQTLGLPVGEGATITYGASVLLYLQELDCVPQEEGGQAPVNLHPFSSPYGRPNLTSYCVATTYFTNVG